MVIAKWKSGFERFYKDISAQSVAEEIYSLGDSATPEEILDKARDNDTELHKCFTWDDGIAAEKWRLREARQVVMMLVIKREEPKEQEDKQHEVRVFHHVPSSKAYKPVEVIIKHQDEYQELLNCALKELQAFKTKYKTLSELEELFEVIDKIAV